ncbi:MAG: BREX system ATP-binding domain-containing protein [Myxococcota bacterium]
MTTIADELARLDQALVDLRECGAASVSLIRCPRRSRERSLVRALAGRGRERDFVTSTVSLLEQGADTPDELVREILLALVPSGESRPRGILWILDTYRERHGKKAPGRFAERAAEEGADGDLTALCLAYLTPDRNPDAEAEAFDSWVNGLVPAKKYQNPSVRTPLSAKTAQRALGELTRVLQALDFAGLLLLLSEGDAIARRTERQREKSYTVLRELVDNFDGQHGAVCTRVVITGTEELFEGPHSIRTLPPLLARLDVPSDAEPPPPHRSSTTLIREPYEYVHRRVARPPERRASALRALIRISEGLPPTEAVSSMSVGHERIERTIQRLFRHMDVAGSVFQVLVGEYGSGKTHLMLHLAERALAERRPVFWLNLERMNLDLGQPRRHLHRLLEQSELPFRGRPSVLSRAVTWTRSPAKLRMLVATLEEIAETDSEESWAADKALRLMDAAEAEEPNGGAHALEKFLSATDLAQRGSGSNYRLDAYRRLLLWIDLLRRIDDCHGAVVLIDEAENLYRSPWSARRTALRTLAFYCGGALPSSCVVMAMTPSAFAELKKEAGRLLREADTMASTLDLEDVDLFRRRISKLQPDVVPTITRNQRLELAALVRKTHRSVRGPVDYAEWDEYVVDLVRRETSPRTIVRALVDQLEAAWWRG